MNTPDPSSSRSPAEKSRFLLAIGGGVLVAAVVVVALVRSPSPTGSSAAAEAAADAASAASAGAGGRAWSEKRPLGIDVVLPAGVWIDVARPALLQGVLTGNAWLTEVADEPLGRGFLGDWAGFLGTSGEEVGLQQLAGGMVGGFIADAVLVQPLRLVWYAGWGGSPPALIIPRPEAALTRTFSALRAVVERGGHVVDGCPAEASASASPTSAPPAAPPAPSNRIEISRLVVADQAVFAALARDRLVFSQSPATVVHAVCGALPMIAASAEADVLLGLAPEKVGREAHAFFGLVGLKGAPAVGFKLDGERLRPVGLAGALARPERLDNVAVPAATWALVPEDLPVAVAANLRLPRSLARASLEAFYGGGGGVGGGGGDGGGALSTRHALVLWQPRGDAKARTEVAVVWSEVADKEGLQAILSGPNAMEVRVVCEHLVAASTPALLARIQAACTQQAPGLTFAEPAVVAGLKAPTSVGVVIDLGRFFAGLLEDGFAQEPERQKVKRGDVPAEITQATRRLRELPRIGLFGDKQGEALAPRGFSS